MNLARKLRDDFDEVLEDLDAIVTPTGIEPARRHLSFNGGPAEWDSISCTFVGNTFGLTHRWRVHQRFQPHRSPCAICSSGPCLTNAGRQS